MTLSDGRRAVEDRLAELDAERDVLIRLLEGYAALDALAQPEPVRSMPAPVSMSEAGDAPPVASPPAARRHRRETFVCSRCNATFKTRGWRDRHESNHPPIPDVSPRGGERIRRTPPGFADREAVSA